MPSELYSFETSRDPVTLPTPEVVTPEEYDAMRPPNSRIELIDGVIRVMTPPTKKHQKVAYQLLRLLKDLCPDTLEVVQEQEIRLEDDHRRNPDIVVAKAGVTGDDDYSYHPKDVVLAVEVVSPGTRITDRKHKPVEYADAGILCYWRVETKPVEVHTYQLGEHGRYESTGVFKLGDLIQVAGLEWAAIEVTQIDR